MIAQLRQSTNLSLVPSPAYSPAVGDAVEFTQLIYGQMRSLVGEVIEVLWGDTIKLNEGTGELIRTPKKRPTVVIAYSCVLPPQAVLEAELKAALEANSKDAQVRLLEFYPEDGIHRGEVELPLEQITFRSRPEPKKLTKKAARQAEKLAAKKAEAERERLEIEAIAELTRQQGDRTNAVIFEAERAEDLHTAISLLEQERDRIKAEGEMGLKGAYIECNPVYKRPNFIQAQWRCNRAVFESSKGGYTSTRYAGKQGSLQHHQAAAAYSRRQRFDAVCAQLEILSKEV